jgi:hypothetical protein
LFRGIRRIYSRAHWKRSVSILGNLNSYLSGSWIKYFWKSGRIVCVLQPLQTNLN